MVAGLLPILRGYAGLSKAPKSPDEVNFLGFVPVTEVTNAVCDFICRLVPSAPRMTPENSQYIVTAPFSESAAQSGSFAGEIAR